MKVRTIFTPFTVDGEVYTLPSVTVPDQAMSIQEIIARFTRTGSVPVASHPIESGNEAFDPGFDPLDFRPDIVDSFKQPEAEKPKESKPTTSPEAEQAEGTT